MKDMNCAYCREGELVDRFGIKILDLKASKVYLFKEQSHLGRVIVASKYHVSEIVDLPHRDRQEFLDDVIIDNRQAPLPEREGREGATWQRKEIITKSSASRRTLRRTR